MDDVFVYGLGDPQRVPIPGTLQIGIAEQGIPNGSVLRLHLKRVKGGPGDGRSIVCDICYLSGGGIAKQRYISTIRLADGEVIDGREAFEESGRRPTDIVIRFGE